MKGGESEGCPLGAAVADRIRIAPTLEIIYLLSSEPEYVLKEGRLTATHLKTGSQTSRPSRDIPRLIDNFNDHVTRTL